MSKRYSNILKISTIILAIIGSLMIASAEMSSSGYSVDALALSIGKQLAIIVLSIVAMYVFSKLPIFRFRIQLYYIFYFIILILLVVPRFIGSVNGAYAWIPVGFFTVQPSEFAKLFLICAGAKIFGFNKGKDKKYQAYYLIGTILYSIIVAFVEHDFGSAAIIICIGFAISMISSSKELKSVRIVLFILFLLLIIGVIVFLSPSVIDLLQKYSDNYIVARIIASANPFKDRYDTGYHLIMSLISFATGGWFGLGYAKSIHKYMNFPNPSTDFILPVIVEEMGIIGFIAIVIVYGLIVFSLIKISLDTKKESLKILCFGTFIYIIVHFVLNVGGVSGLLPLTGVPLLLLSSGGSSTLSFFLAIGLCSGQTEKEIKENENNSR